MTAVVSGAGGRREESDLERGAHDDQQVALVEVDRRELAETAWQRLAEEGNVRLAEAAVALVELVRALRPAHYGVSHLFDGNGPATHLIT